MFKLLIKTNLSISFSWIMLSVLYYYLSITYYSVLSIICLSQNHKYFLPFFSYKFWNFRYYIRSMIHSQLFILYGTKFLLKHIFKHMNIQLFYLCVENNFYHLIAFAPLLKISHSYVGQFMYSLHYVSFINLSLQ